MARTGQESHFGDLRALLHEPASPALWRELLSMLRAWPDVAQREREIVPYVRAHVQKWPLSWRALDPDHVLLCDRATSEVMLRRWNSAYSDVLPLVAEDAGWLRHVLGHLEYDVRHAVKLQPLIHAGAFSRVRSVHFVHHETPRDFLADLQRVLRVRGGEPLERLGLESCFFHDEAAELLLRCVDPTRIEELALNHSIKPSAITSLCDESWGNVRRLELTGDLLRLEDVRVLLQSELCRGLEHVRLGYLLDARGEDVQPLVRELDELLVRDGGLKSLALPGLHLTGRAMHLLASSEAVRHVRALDLRDNILSVEAIEALSGEGSKFEQLEHLRLGQWLVQDDMLHALLSSPLAARLKTLDVMRCNLNPLTHVSLLSKKNLPSLERLALSEVRLSRALFERVSKAWQEDEGEGLKSLAIDQLDREEDVRLEELVQSAVGRWWRAIEELELGVMQSRTSRFASDWAQDLRVDTHQRFTLTQPGVRAGEEFEAVWRELC